MSDLPTPVPNDEGTRVLYAAFDRSNGGCTEVVHREYRGRHVAQIVSLRHGYRPFVISVAQIAQLIEALQMIQSSIREVGGR